MRARALRVQLTATEALPTEQGNDSGASGRPVFVLTNPKYVQRKKVITQQRPPQQDARPPRQDTRSRDASSRDRSPSGPKVGAKNMDMSSMDGDVEPASGGSGKPTSTRRQTKLPDKKRKDSEGERNPPNKRQERGGRRGRQFDDDNVATARNPRKRAGSKGGKRGTYPPPPPTGPARVVLSEAITVGELASALDVGAAAVVKDLMKMGVLASITQSIDVDTAEKIALGFGAEVIKGADEDAAAVGALGVIEDEDEDEVLVGRPPVVTIMGHVDHGKTSLLDALREGNTAMGEAGGITQHIGAYSVAFPDSIEVGKNEDGTPGRVTFIDTPGHAAFSEMRSRGANVTDVVILVVAADDGVMEQTVQSINAARAAEVPMIVALTKSDKEGADIQKVKLQLLEKEVVLEEFGGDVLSAQVSAKTGDGLAALMEQIALQADMLDLKANPERSAQGSVIEARQVQGQGAVATVLVQRGTLRQTDIVVVGAQWGRVRRLSNDKGETVDEAKPSEVVELVGLSGLPEAGDALTVVPDDARAREVAETRQRLLREKRSSSLFASRSSLEQQLFLGGLSDGELPTKLLDFIVKSDVQGSAEALSSALSDLSAADDKLQVKTRVLRYGAGAITNEDIMLASVSNAVVIGFNSAASAQQRDEAFKAGVAIKEFNVVYDALDDVRAMMASLIRPPPSKQLGALIGNLDVQQLFKVGSIGKVAGCKVINGLIKVGCNIRILRGNLIVYEGKLQSLRSGKEIVESVEAPNECGISFEDFQTMEPTDRVEAYAARETVDDEDD
uniref:Translation initiation factor IF-2, chloroplastic n=1 Tax=Haptolina brevifila TaxID=156173 RepID=A0A7S2HRE2_9EUKA